MAKTTVVHPDGTRTEKEWSGDTVPSLEWLQAAVGDGFIELVVDRRELKAFANEEGRIKALPENPRAHAWLCELRPELFTTGPCVVGPVVFCEGFNPKGW